MFLYVSLSKTSASALSAGPDDFLGASFQSRFICERKILKKLLYHIIQPTQNSLS